MLVSSSPPLNGDTLLPQDSQVGRLRVGRKDAVGGELGGCYDGIVDNDSEDEDKDNHNVGAR